MTSSRCFRFHWFHGLQSASYSLEASASTEVDLSESHFGARRPCVLDYDVEKQMLVAQTGEFSWHMLLLQGNSREPRELHHSSKIRNKYKSHTKHSTSIGKTTLTKHTKHFLLPSATQKPAGKRPFHSQTHGFLRPVARSPELHWSPPTRPETWHDRAHDPPSNPRGLRETPRLGGVGFWKVPGTPKTMKTKVFTSKKPGF